MPWIIPAIGAAIAALTVVEIIVIAAVIAIGLTVLTSRNMSGVTAAPPVPGTTFQTNPLQLTVSADAPRRMAYGKTRISGVLAYHNVSGEGHEYYTMVIMVAAHEVDAITQMYFDGKACDDANNSPAYTGFYEWRVHLGNQTTADAGLMADFPEWNHTCILYGIAYVIVKLKYDKAVWQNGRPNVTFDVRGKKCYDPRSGLTVWTNNAALCTADYLMYEDGLQAEFDEMDWGLVRLAADISAQMPDGMNSSMCDGRYTIDGVVELSSRNADVINAMLAAMAGTVVWSDGKYRLYAGALMAPVSRAITVEDMRAEFTLQPRAAADQSFNGVRGTFLDASNNWVFTDFPPVVDPEAVTADGGAKIYRDIVLQFTTSPLTAQRLAVIFLRRARLEKSITLQCKWTCFNYEVWDVVPLNMPDLGWEGKLFQIQDWKMIPPSTNEAGGIDLTLLEYGDDIYDDAMTLKPIGTPGVISTPDVTAPNPLSALFATSGVSSTDGSGNPFVRFDWPASSDIYAVGYELAWGRYPFTPVEADYSTFVPGRSAFTYTVGPVTPGDMYVGFIRVLNSFDRRSIATESNPVVARSIGSEYPENVAGLSATLPTGQLVDLAWTTPATTPQYAEIRWSPSLDGAGSITVARVAGTQTTARLTRQTSDGYYHVLFLSSAGLYSLVPSSVAVAARVPGTLLHNLGFSEAEGDLTGAIWINGGTQAVSQSTKLASELGWEVFDLMVPNPVSSIEYWRKTATYVASGTIKTNGTVGRQRAPTIPGTLPIIAASAKVAYFDSTVIVQGEYTLTADANIKLGFIAPHTEAQGVVVTGFNGTLEKL